MYIHQWFITDGGMADDIPMSNGSSFTNTKFTNETNIDTFREEPRAINFSISNRSGKSKENETIEKEGKTINKEPASPSHLIPGHDMHYSGRSKANILSFSPLGIYLNCMCIIFCVRMLLFPT